VLALRLRPRRDSKDEEEHEDEHEDEHEGENLREIVRRSLLIIRTHGCMKAPA
jgi:hypothetical protein